MPRRLALAVSVLLLSLPLPAEPARADVEYTVILDQPQTQMVTIRVRLDDVQGDTVDVSLPVWRPGRYVVLNQVSSIRDVAATTTRGRPLAVERVDKSTWRLSGVEGGLVELTYRVYANSIADRTRHVDDTHAFLSGESVFMYAPTHRGEPVRLRIEAPDGWRTATGLRSGPAEHTFVAADYDELADCPLEIGEHELVEFEVDGVPHEIVIWPPGVATYDETQLREDFTKIIEHQASIFEGMPYERYVFLVHVGGGGGGGTEHRNSTIMQTRPGALEGGSAYDRFLGLVSHEFFHTWNVKRLRPAGLVPYDYQRENYTTLLWVAEGTTSYYDDLTLVRTGLMTTGRYLSTIGRSINSIRNRPGARVQSLAASSFDAWTKFYHSTPDDANSTVSFYSKGALMSLLLDLEIRRRTNHEVSLDDVMREMLRRHPLTGSGYTADDLIAVIEELSRSSVRELFVRHVDGTETMPLEEAILAFGLELKRTSSEDDAQEAFLGLSLRDEDGRSTVRSVRSDGPAYTAGIIAGDEVVALDGRRVGASTLDDRLEKLAPGDAIELLVFRRDELRTFRITLAGRAPGTWKLEKVEEPTDEQKTAYASWIGQDW